MKNYVTNFTPLWQNSVWSIEKNKKGTEIAVSDSYNVYYAYLSKCGTMLVWGNFYPIPKYIQKKALTLAKKNITSIYA